MKRNRAEKLLKKYYREQFTCVTEDRSQQKILFIVRAAMVFSFLVCFIIPFQRTGMPLHKSITLFIHEIQPELTTYKNQLLNYVED